MIDIKKALIIALKLSGLSTENSGAVKMKQSLILQVVKKSLLWTNLVFFIFFVIVLIPLNILAPFYDFDWSVCSYIEGSIFLIIFSMGMGGFLPYLLLTAFLSIASLRKLHVKERFLAVICSVVGGLGALIIILFLLGVSLNIVDTICKI